MTMAELLAELKPMSIVQDLEFASELLKAAKSKKVIEFGAGAGGWILTMNHLVPDVTFIAVENFSIAFGDDWPKTKASWLLYVHNKAFAVGNDLSVTIMDKDVTEMKFKGEYDAVRFDCLTNMKDITKLIDKVMPHTSETSLFFVDDISPNTCPGRFMAFMEKSLKNELLPVWFGHKEGAWCKNINL